MIYRPGLATTEENGLLNNTAEAKNDPMGMSFEESTIESMDGVRIHVRIVWAPNADARQASTIIFCQTNVGDFSLGRILLLANETRSNVVLWSYRGYGSSTGTPNEVGIRHDAVALSRWLVTRGDIDTRKVFWYGVSLGGAVAAHAVADTLNDPTTCPSAGLILENTLTSIPDMAIAPSLSLIKMIVSPFIRDKWDTAAIAPLLGSSVPTLFISSLNDWKVWPHQMNKLHKTFTSAHVAAREALRVDPRVPYREPAIHTFRAGHMDIPTKMPGGWAGCIEKFIDQNCCYVVRLDEREV